VTELWLIACCAASKPSRASASGRSMRATPGWASCGGVAHGPGDRAGYC